ncbi:unnamed protein product [Soboliphyme baturini]|uniref:Titin n=1 Tax=Soboliphyme baturini TaxID=241478 RepID=A0A183IQA7_9BILA|nr:unnamed protein product [Soboliphyme baturini]
MSLSLFFQYEPVNDPQLRIEWYLNGKPLVVGSKYHMRNEFGLVTMDILYTFPQDSGVYTCKAISTQGEASSSGTIKCQAKETILRAPFNVSSVKKIAELEAPKPGAAEVPESPPVQPTFSTNIQDLLQLVEGQSAHFEASVEPINDPRLVIQWYHNGKLVSATSRMKYIHDFGMVILDITQLMCKPREKIIYDSQQPQSLERIKVLEMPKEAVEEPAAKPPEAPRFVTKLPMFPPLIESDSAHLEAQLTPTNDPKMKIQWFRNGKLLPTGHRFKQIYDFGFCVFDIIGMTAEDSGEYKCVATNESGTDSTSTTLQCQPKGSLFLEPISIEKAKAVHDLEESLVKVPAEAPPEKPQMAPVFLKPLQNPPPLQEGDNAHLEATISPVNDPNLKIEWFLNGKALKTGSRVKAICDFGFVILEITPVYPEDSGEYLCRASNRLGEAVTSAHIVCESKDKIIRRSQLPESYSGAQQKIEILETAKPAPEMEPEPVYGKPILEPQDETGQVAHFEFKLEPAEDPNMKVEWFHNGHPVSHSKSRVLAHVACSRLKTINDFGFVILEIAPAEPHDSGTYSCRASNAQGSCSADIELQVEEFLPETEFDPPKFTEPLTDFEEQPEGNSIRFECKLEPLGDPTLRIEWLHNGRPIPYSTRIQTQHDFGTAVLIIQHIIPEDSGEYTCKATNSKGQASTTCSLVCRYALFVINNSHVKMPNQFYDPEIILTYLSHEGLFRSKREIEMPRFVSPLISTISDIKEGDTVHLECRVTPVDDPHLVIQWYFNGKPLKTAHRFKTTFDFGFVSLDILYAYPEDSGTYVCKASNEKGEAETSCSVTILGKPRLVFQRQAPVQTADELKRHFSQYTTAEIDDKRDKPRFVTKIENVAISEGDFARFECQLAPINDPNLKVEWFHNGEPIILGHRFLAIHEFGYVALVLLYALPVDTGEYVARAINKYGHDTVKAKLACVPKKRVITESQLPPGFSVAEISKLEEQLYWSQMGETETEEVKKAKFPPVFTISPRRIQAVENEPARFECAVSGNPAPRVTWFINGRQAVTGSRFKLSYDGMHYFSIPRVIPQDAGEIICVARNSEGEVQVAATLDVFELKDFRTHKLKTGKRESETDALQREEKWKQEMLGSLGQVFEKAPKPSFQKLLEVEAAKEPVEPLESEELKQKFQRKRHDEIYEKILPPDQTKVRGPSGFTETVQLKPTRLQQRELPKEEKINVELRSTPRKEKPPEEPQVPAWQMGLKKLNVEAMNLLPPPEKEVEISAKDQIKLRPAKPKPADQPTEFEHFKLASEKPIPKSGLRQKESEPEVEPSVPAKQVALKPSFAPKAALPAEQANIAAVQLKPTVHRPPAGQSMKQPPMISKQLQPCSTEIGRSAELLCEFTGDKPLTINWLFDGKPITSSFEFQVGGNVVRNYRLS